MSANVRCPALVNDRNEAIASYSSVVCVGIAHDAAPWMQIFRSVGKEGGRKKRSKKEVEA